MHEHYNKYTYAGAKLTKSEARKKQAKKMEQYLKVLGYFT